MHDPERQTAYCRGVLPRVSRTFALGIELLRDPLRDRVGVAYLICRILDTLEDTGALHPRVRAEFLEQAGAELFRRETWRGCCRAIAALFPEADFPGDEADLCRKAEDVLELYHGFPGPVREAIAGPAGEMAAGMARTVRREETPGRRRLETVADLDEYCYYVAGTVGAMLTGLFSLDRPSITDGIRERLRPAGIDFGLGLQLTNIVKGVTDDIARGVSYLPRELLEASGAALEELLADPADPRAERLADALVELALPRLDRGLEYTLAIPSGERDLRLFCALPLFFAVRTLGLASGPRVFGREPLKISREEVSRIHLRLEETAGDDEGLKREYFREKERQGFPV